MDCKDAIEKHNAFLQTKSAKLLKEGYVSLC